MTRCKHGVIRIPGLENIAKLHNMGDELTIFHVGESAVHACKPTDSAFIPGHNEEPHILHVYM